MPASDATTPAGKKFVCSSSVKNAWCRQDGRIFERGAGGHNPRPRTQMRWTVERTIIGIVAGVLSTLFVTLPFIPAAKASPNYFPSFVRGGSNANTNKMSADEQPQGLNGMDLIIDGELICIPAMLLSNIRYKQFFAQPGVSLKIKHGFSNQDCIIAIAVRQFLLRHV